MVDETRNIELHFESNASQVNQDVSQLNNSIDSTTDSTARNTTATHSNTNAFKSNSNAVLENGGAMGLLNDLTGGYAMMVKDAVEASALFTRAKKADTLATSAGSVATNISTVSTVSNNTATQSSIINRIKDTIALGANAVARGVVTTATTIATGAQWLWNTAVLANPLVALTAGLVAAGAAIYTFTKYLIDSSEANKSAAKATAKHKAELESQSISAAKSAEKLATHNQYLYDMASAAGASSEELRKLRLKHIEEEIALNKSNATIASNTFIRERSTLATLRAAGASDEVIEAQKKVTESSYKELQEQNSLLTTSYKQRADIKRANNVEITKENTDARAKAKEEAVKAKEEAKKAEKAKNEGILEARKKYLQETAIGDELNPVGIDNIIAKIKSDGELENQAKKEVMEADLENKVVYGENLVAEARTRQEAINAVEAELEAKRVEAKKQVFDNIATIVGAETAVGKAALVAKQILLAKELVMEISKTITFSAQAAARSTVALAEGTAQTAKVGFPQNIPLLIGYAAQAAGIFAAIRSAVKASKANISLPTTSSSVGAATAPSVSFVSSSENQLATSISSQNARQAPIKAYVVSKDMSTAQELDRNLITTTTID